MQDKESPVPPALRNYKEELLVPYKTIHQVKF